MMNDILISTISWSFEGLITLLLFTAKKRKLKFHIFSSQYLEEKMKFVYKARTAYTMEFFDRVSNPEQIFTFQLSMQ